MDDGDGKYYQKGNNDRHTKRSKKATPDTFHSSNTLRKNSKRRTWQPLSHLRPIHKRSEDAKMKVDDMPMVYTNFREGLIYITNSY